MNRGSRGLIEADRRLRRSFNEAPIHESGKCSNCGWKNKKLSSFNEAPIHESGKWARRPGLRKSQDLRASMRPRFMNRGSTTLIEGGKLIFSASMRPRFMNRGSDSWNV